MVAETVTYSADFELTRFHSGIAIAVGSLWPGHEEDEASGFALDRNGRVRYDAWSLHSDPFTWLYNVPNGAIYVLAIRAINEDNHEIVYFF